MIGTPLYIATIVTGLASASGDFLHCMYSRDGASIDAIPSMSMYNGVSVDREYIYSSIYCGTESSYREMTSIEASIQTRSMELRRSFNRNSSEVSLQVQAVFNKMTELVSVLPFNDNLSFYNEVDGSVDIKVMMPHDFCLNVSHFVEDNDYVVFTLHKGHKLLVADELQIEEFGSKVGEFAKMFNDDEA